VTEKPSSPESDDYKPQRRFVVRGQVRRAGRPVVGAGVEVYEQHMRGRKLLGTTTTGDDGHYERDYSKAELSRPGRPEAGLVVRVVERKGQVLVESAVLFNAGPDETVDLLIGESRSAQSEYDRLIEDLTPLLGEVPRHDLSGPDAAFLAGQTGWDAQFITWLGDSARRHREADSIPESIFYGLFRQRMPTAIPELVARDLLILRELLERSSQAGIIPVLSSAELDQAIERLRALRVELYAETGRAGPGVSGRPARRGSPQQRQAAHRRRVAGRS